MPIERGVPLRRSNAIGPAHAERPSQWEDLPMMSKDVFPDFMIHFYPSIVAVQGGVRRLAQRQLLCRRIPLVSLVAVGQ